MRTEGEEELPWGEAAAPHPAWGGAAAVFRARKQRGHLLPAVGEEGRSTQWQALEAVWRILAFSLSTRKGIKEFKASK